MKNNPFASFAAGTGGGGGGGNNAKAGSAGGGNGGGGWLSTRKVGRDDTDIKRSKAIAALERRVKKGGGAGKGGGGGGGAKKKRGGGGGGWGRNKRDSFFDSSDDDESVHRDYEEGVDGIDNDDDSFVVHSDDEGFIDNDDEDEGDWDSNMEDDDDDDDYDGASKKKKTKSASSSGGGRGKKSSSSSANKSKSKSNSTSRRNATRTTTQRGNTSGAKKPISGKTKKKSPVITVDDSSEEEFISEDDDDDDDVIDVTMDESDSDSDNNNMRSRKNRGASRLGKENNSNKRSKYFASTDKGSSRNDSDEEKKEDETDIEVVGDVGHTAQKRGRNARTAAATTTTPNRKRRILDDDDTVENESDSSSDDEALWGNKTSKKPASTAKVSTSPVNLLDDNDDDNKDNHSDEDGLSDTPKKKSSSTTFVDDDFVDDDEACAIQAAMKASLADQGDGNGDDDDGRQQFKRLKKKTKKSSSRGRKHNDGGSLGKLSSSSSSTSSLSKKKNGSSSGVIYKDDIPGYNSNDDNDDDPHEDEEDDEVEVVLEDVDHEEQTAAQVLAEANALSAKIVNIVSGWCGVGNEEGSGSINNGHGKLGVKGLLIGEDGALNLGSCGGVGSGGGKESSWISNDTMKAIMPNVDLAEYQLLGVNWMALLDRTTFGGNGKGGKKSKNVNGILADEMGLGKTVQTIAFLAWLNHQKKVKSEGSQRPHLIVVPASVLSNWMVEFKKFAPHMIVVKYHGSQSERDEIRDDMDRKFVRGNDRLDAVMTTFSYFSSDSNKGDRTFLRKFDFDYLVIDEGHTLKNPKGLRYKNLNKFSTTHRLLLTGTPVQNSPKELMSLLCFLMPLFDGKVSKRKKGYDDDSDDDNDGGERMLEYFVHLEGASTDDATAYRKLKQLFAPFVLRRKKEDVLGQILPPKNRRVDIVPMDESTQAAYDAIISSHVKARAERSSDLVTSDAASQKHLFTTLRKAANHPLLLRNRFTSEEEKENLAHLALNYGWFGNDASCTLRLVREELDKYSDYEIHCAAIQMIEENPRRKEHLEKYTLMEEDLFCSPKFVRLRSLLPELIEKGHRILIFSQWTKVLDLMGHLLHSLHLSNHLRLDGQTAVSDRQDLIDKFTNDASISCFLLSTRAGGLGLNLTSADVCILHDLDFNPFNDRQAEDRCHRIGQKKPVTIIKMVTEGTVDEDIYKIQERKSRMNDAIMEEEGSIDGKKSNESDEMCRLANAAVERFLKSPK